jgi:pimeloyl-ACP methyl ester carboxylesterase
MTILRAIIFSLWMIQGALSADCDCDRVLQVPNFEGDVCWSQYAGYLNATEDHQLFYWYHEAVTAPEEKPLVLWLNGGPGCSSLGGMFTELGPFVLDKNLKVTLNPFSFNKVANILFLEQPAGVGFSYPNVPANDASTALDTDTALRSFLATHPELQGRPFFVMGESYGGHYVPNTAKQIQISNDKLHYDSPERINLKGFAVGNGYTDWQLDFNANVENGRYHALTSQALLEKAQKACDGDYARCFWPREDVECPIACQEAVQEAVQHGEDGTIDIYDIYNDVCLEDHQERLETQSTTFLKHRREARLKKLTLSPLTSSSRELRATISPVFPTCIDAFTQAYLNLPQVHEAIHVKPETIPNGKWADCGNVDYEFNYESELDNYLQWIEDGDLEILICKYRDGLEVEVNPISQPAHPSHSTQQTMAIVTSF